MGEDGDAFDAVARSGWHRGVAIHPGMEVELTGSQTRHSKDPPKKASPAPADDDDEAGTLQTSPLVGELVRTVSRSRGGPPPLQTLGDKAPDVHCRARAQQCAST